MGCLLFIPRPKSTSFEVHKPVAKQVVANPPEATSVSNVESLYNPAELPMSSAGTPSN